MTTRTDELRGAGAAPRGSAEGRRAPHLPHSAREVLAANLGRDPYHGIEELREVGERKARAEGIAYELDKSRDAVLARIANELAAVHAGEALSEAKLKRMAEGDPRYAEHLKKTAAAVTEKERAHAEYWAIKSELEWDTEALRHLNHMSRLGG